MVQPRKLWSGASKQVTLFFFFWCTYYRQGCLMLPFFAKIWFASMVVQAITQQHVWWSYWSWGLGSKFVLCVLKKKQKKKLKSMGRSVEAAPESRKAGLELIGRTLWQFGEGSSRRLWSSWGTVMLKWCDVMGQESSSSGNSVFAAPMHWRLFPWEHIPFSWPKTNICWYQSHTSWIL